MPVSADEQLPPDALITIATGFGTLLDVVQALCAKVFPPMVELVVDPPTVDAGKTATLSWKVENGVIQSFTGPDGPIDPSKITVPIGSLVITPTKDSEYTLTLAGVGGIFSATVSVKVGATPPPTAPTISSFLDANRVACTSAPGGSVVYIVGTNFGTVVGTITIAGIAATAESWSDTEVKVTLPAVPADTTGALVLTRPDGAQATAPFTIKHAPTNVTTLIDVIDENGLVTKSIIAGKMYRLRGTNLVNPAGSMRVVISSGPDTPYAEPSSGTPTALYFTLNNGGFAITNDKLRLYWAISGAWTVVGELDGYSYIM